MLSARQVSAVEEAAWFQTNWTSNLLVDDDFCIRAANSAYQRATGYPRDALIAHKLFDVFPDNPANPDADGVANTTASMELVFRRGARHWMGVQRHDIPDRQRPGEFNYRVWTPVNSPIHDAGRTVAVLHQVQDVTRVVPWPGGPAELAGLKREAEVLGRQFPKLPFEAVLSVLTHSYSVVVEAAGAPDVEPDFEQAFNQATALARVRLETRAGHPADEI